MAIPRAQPTNREPAERNRSGGPTTDGSRYGGDAQGTAIPAERTRAPRSRRGRPSGRGRPSSRGRASAAAVLPSPRPRALGHPLTDSPVGRLARIAAVRRRPPLPLRAGPRHRPHRPSAEPSPHRPPSPSSRRGPTGRNSAAAVISRRRRSRVRRSGACGVLPGPAGALSGRTVVLRARRARGASGGFAPVPYDERMRRVTGGTRAVSDPTGGNEPPDPGYAPWTQQRRYRTQRPKRADVEP